MFTKLFGVLLTIVGMLSWVMPASADTGNEWKSACAECHESGDYSDEKTTDVTQKILDISAGKLKHKKAFKLDAKTAADIAAILTSEP